MTVNKNMKDFIIHWSNQWPQNVFPQISSDVFLLTTCAKSREKDKS